MDILPKLSPAQNLLLRTAASRADGRVIPPANLRGGARVKVLTALLQRGWIKPADDGYVMTDAGYAAIGQQRPMPPDDVQPMEPPTTSSFWRPLRRYHGGQFQVFERRIRRNPLPALSFLPWPFSRGRVQTCKPGTHRGSHLSCSSASRTRPR